jgi:hypothetical protein
MLAVEVPAPASGNAVIRRIRTKVHSYYTGLSPSFVDDTISQEIVQLYLSDTTATRFGMGWQLAELGRLITGVSFKAAPAAVWVSGDGSYTIFRKPASTWLSPPARPHG